MRLYIDIAIRRGLAACVALLAGVCAVQAQELLPDSADAADTKAIMAKVDSMIARDEARRDSLLGAAIVADSLPAPAKAKRDWATWHPDPKRALWLALVIPGGGQIYNRKYWKLPLVYGGFVGCAYAMSWNNMMYKDYSQAYLDIMDDDPGTQSYNRFMHLANRITPENESRWKTIFKKRKDRFRRWRDMSFFVMVGVYALSVIDAYVDAELSEFDISKDLSLRVEPTIIDDKRQNNWLNGSSIGLQCSLNF